MISETWSNSCWKFSVFIAGINNCKIYLLRISQAPSLPNHNDPYHRNSLCYKINILLSLTRCVQSSSITEDRTSYRRHRWVIPIHSLTWVLLHQAPSPSSAPPPSPPVTSSRTSNTSSPTIVASPMARPAPYSGSAEECNGFILQCNLTLEMQPRLYPTDSSKVAFIISLLAGPALQWAETIWAKSGPVVQSLRNFMIHFREVFGKVDGDTSVGEQLCHLQQGSMSIAEYSLKFRTLAAASGWNERSLLTTYRLGLEPQLRLQLAAYDDTCGLDKFIQLSVRCSDRMQSCFAVPQIATSNAFLRRSEPFHPPDPAPEPMIIVRQQLSSAERQRRLTRGLCLYCGAQGHIILACPLRPPRPVVSAILPKIVKMEPLTTCVTLTASNVSISVSALLDSGSAGNFISRAPCHPLSLQATTTEIIYQVQWITGKPLSRRHVKHRVGPITLRIGLFHTEDIHLLVLEGSTADIILGRPWLVQSHKIQAQSYPVMENRGILKRGKDCFPGCFPVTPSTLKTATKVIPVNSTTIESPIGKQSVDIPACYAPFSDVCRQKTAADVRRAETPTYHPGQKVWLSTRDIRLCLPCRKLSPRFVGPFTILEQVNPVTYKLQLPPQYRIHPMFHVSLLKPHHEPVSLPTEPGQTEEPPPPLILDKGSVYKVKEILQSRRRGGQLQYLVDWERYGPEEWSWVPRTDILDPALLTEFHAAHPDQPAPRGRGRPPRRRGVRPSGAGRGGGSTVTDQPGSITTQSQQSLSPEYWTPVFNQALHY